MSPAAVARRTQRSPAMEIVDGVKGAQRALQAVHGRRKRGSVSNGDRLKAARPAHAPCLCCCLPADTRLPSLSSLFSQPCVVLKSEVLLCVMRLTRLLQRVQRFVRNESNALFATSPMLCSQRVQGFVRNESNALFAMRPTFCLQRPNRGLSCSEEADAFSGSALELSDTLEVRVPMRLTPVEHARFTLGLKAEGLCESL
eukprot:62163-Pleurochrysis_carterae.AAC.2